MSNWLPTGVATFAALDFETADRHSDSACAIGLARVEAGAVVQVVHRHIRPPRNSFEHSWVHGITWEHVCAAPTFAELWPEISELLKGCEFLCAHNAGFERRVLTTCLGAAGIAMPSQPIHCTVQLARRTWALPRHNLPSVCTHLGIHLRHHDAASDAEACARIVLAAARQAEGSP
jgi:DNA polymerase-3 subunit epsilon